MGSYLVIFSSSDLWVKVTWLRSRTGKGHLTSRIAANLLLGDSCEMMMSGLRDVPEILGSGVLSTRIWG
jgi:hypothetical protein